MGLNFTAQAMEKKFNETLAKYHMLSENDSVIAAVSGGADSVCMLYLLLQAGVKPVVIHVHHMIRGGEADRDAQFVSALSARLGLKCEVVYKDVPSLAASEGLSLEQAARELRYEALFQSAQRLNIKKIAVAHNLNDQAETMLLRLIRGSGLAGLGGMLPVRADGIIRPLLGFTRSEIEGYCAEKDISYIQDSTNASEEYSRNYVRARVIPVMEQLNPALCQTLANSARLMARDEEYLSLRAKKEYKRLAGPFKKGVALQAGELAKLDKAIAARVVRLAVEETCGLKDITAGQIESVLDLINAGTGKWVSLKRGAGAQKSYGQIIFAEREEQTEDFAFPFEFGIFRAGSITITVSAAEKFEGRTAAEEYFDLSKVPQDAVIRNRRPGDVIFPLGAPGVKKLKDYFIDKKVPRWRRERLVLLASGQEILAVVGMTVSEKIAVGKDTANIAVIRTEDKDA